MAVRCDWTCDRCGADEDDAGLAGPPLWDLTNDGDFCDTCSMERAALDDGATEP